MNWLNKLPNSRPSPPGLEIAILKRLPMATLACTAIALFCYLLSHYLPTPDAAISAERSLMDASILIVASLITAYTAIFTRALGCFIVYLMKGPAYGADVYELVDADAPEDHRPEQRRR